MQEPDFIIASDNTILVKFGEKISNRIRKRVLSFCQHLIKYPLPFVVGLSPGYSSILIRIKNDCIINNCKTEIKLALKSKLKNLDYKPDLIEIPVCYDYNLSPDIDRVKKITKLDKEKIISLHSSNDYIVYFIGFSPHFPYLGGMTEALITPRLDSPRTKVPSGSVGIADDQTGIYPLSTPGGWNIIGRTPLNLLEENNSEKSIIKMGDIVRFVPIKFDEYENIKRNQ
tara:strand:- start:6794 stop:7477 length:684 start_codon:yes stop_codon:yes gene_type:complete